MKAKSNSTANRSNFRLLPLFVLVLAFSSSIPARSVAQSPVDSSNAETAAAIQSRIERARALAAAHQLAAAASELESLRVMSTDESVRNVTSVMLMNIYLEEGNYARAESLLDETFRRGSSKKDSSIGSYFALAGQAVNGARSHLARYRSFGINISDAGLPAEALSDLDRLRSLLERMIVQAKVINKDDSNAYDSLALLEDILGLRLSLSRNSEEREKWGNEYAAARERLASSQKQIASLREMPLADKRTDSGSASDSRGDTLRTLEIGTDHLSENPEPSGTSASPKSPEEVAATSEKAGDTTISAGLLNPRAARKVVPSYPQTAKSAGVAGVVRVYVGVNEGGKVTSVFRSEGPALLHQAAEDAARKWTFPPTLIQGKPAKLIGFIEFKFTL